ncbi:hypothetical protein EOI86_06030 [Hwanghaeella grinnelliae]|uniref:Uncharacterized protein n=1 Tax=Hwanghaeella grinnelliae TaxID=2500179 RepID=A0A3S2VPU4_9PROT|nr:hypothetical protein EOI86_06030 [Hwanghaeella grinnelliae]
MLRPDALTAGTEDQQVPLMILATGENSPHQTSTHRHCAFIGSKDGNLTALSGRYGFSDPRP